MQANNKVVTGRAQFHIFISHLHWDHIQGLPFFLPAYKAKNSIRVLGYEGARAGLAGTATGNLITGNITGSNILDVSAGA